jgi:hypothetical protein
MTEETEVKTGRKPRPKYNPNNKEQGSQNKKKRWKKHYKQPKKDLGKSLQELQSFINGKFHTQ